MRWIPVVLCSVCSVLGSVASAATLRVPQDFPTIQAAVDDAGPGDTIRVAKGTYFENVVVPAGKDGLRIRGAGKGTIVDARPFGPVGSGPAFEVTCVGFTLENLTVRHALGFSPFGVYVNGQNAIVRRIKVHGCPETGIGVIGNGARVEQCEIHGSERGLVVAGGNLLVRKVTVHNPGEAGIMIGGTSSSVRQCRVVHAGESGIVAMGQDLVLEKNVVDGAQDDGIIVDCNDSVTIRSNTVRNVTQANGAIAVASATDGIIANNFATDCNAAALYLHATLANVTVKGNRGMRCGATDGSTFHVEASECSLIGNRAQDGNGDGFRVLSLSNTLAKNVALRCAMDGFDVQASSSLHSNVARGNHAEGLDVSAVGVLLVKNVARGNRTDVSSTVAIDTFIGNQFVTGGDGVAPQIDD